MQLIIRAAECVTHQNNTFFIFAQFPALPLTLRPSLQQEYLQAALQDNGAQLPRAKSPVALTNVVSTEQDTLCSHIRVKYLLFISAKTKGGGREKKCNNRESGIDCKERGWGEGELELEAFQDVPWQRNWGTWEWSASIFKYGANRIYPSEKVQQSELKISQSKMESAQWPKFVLGSLWDGSQVHWKKI